MIVKKQYFLYYYELVKMQNLNIQKDIDKSFQLV
jgi:hypothetical protein